MLLEFDLVGGLVVEVVVFIVVGGYVVLLGYIVY